MSLQVLLNGEPRELPEGSTVADVVASLPGVPDGRGMAVAMDGVVVPRTAWGRTELSDGARVEIVVAVQGG
jgi:sulfur carrier protein